MGPVGFNGVPPGFEYQILFPASSHTSHSTGSGPFTHSHLTDPFYNLLVLHPNGDEGWAPGPAYEPLVAAGGGGGEDPDGYGSSGGDDSDSSGDTEIEEES